MNRKDRRAAIKQGRGGEASSRASWSAATFAQAVRYHQLGEWLAAEACCRAVLARDPKHVGSLQLLGVIAQQAGRFDEAATLFRNVIRLKPEMAPAHHGLGTALVATGKLEEAISAFERALAIQQRNPAAPGPDEAESLLNLGYLYARLGKPEKAVALHERAVALKPDFAEAHNNFGALLLAQGKLKEASAEFARALALTPELFEKFADVSATLLKLNPTLGDAVQRATAAWPRLLPPDDVLRPHELNAIAADPMLRCVLESTTVRDIALERFLTSARAAVLKLAENAAGEAEGAALGFCSALAQQCFINEYVFADTPEELAKAERLKQALIAALEGKTAVAPLRLAAVACYFPLGSLPDPQSVLDRTWPEAIERVLTQQIREVQQERQLRDGIPRLTAIGDGTSALVRQQYEENPYPRWVLAPSQQMAVTVDEDLRARFPMAPFRPLGERNGVDILIAGCGTGEHPIGMARRYREARVLAVDLSLSSLCYAQRKTRELGLHNIDYAQADILQLASLGRSFDIIDAGGVLHHLAEPTEGWRRLLALLRPGGVMRLGLYSEHGRADVVAARRFIAERGFRPTAADIRRCRHELMSTPLHVLTRYHDFFSTSECRDLLFHVQEHRLTIPQFKEFLLAQNLRFIGFELDAASLQAYHARFPDDQGMADLDHWNAFEIERPVTFAAMYQFWCQQH